MIKRLMVPVAALFLALYLTVPASAETSLDIFTGKAWTKDSNITLQQPTRGNMLTFHGVSFRDDSFKTPFYYGIRLSHFFENRPSLGLALEFVHYKILADIDTPVLVTGTRLGVPFTMRVPPRDVGLQQFDISHGVNLLTLNVIKRVPLGQLQPYVGLGAGVAINHPETVVDGQAKERYEFGGEALQAFTGIRWTASDRVRPFLEFKMTWTSPTVKLAIGEARLNIRTTHIVGGVGINF